MKLRSILASGLLALSLGAIVTAPIVLTGCAAFGVQRPDTLGKSIIAGYQTVAGIADSVGVLFTADKLSKEEARDALNKVQQLKASLDVAAQLRDAGDFANAETRLQATISALEILRAALAAKGGG